MAIDYMHLFLAQASGTILQVAKDHKEQLASEKKRSNSLKAQMTDLTSQVMKVEKLFRKSSSKERIALAKVLHNGRRTTYYAGPSARLALNDFSVPGTRSQRRRR